MVLGEIAGTVEMIVTVLAGVALAWKTAIVLAGPEGYLLSNSVKPWLKGFLKGGLIGLVGAIVLGFFMDAELTSPMSMLLIGFVSLGLGSIFGRYEVAKYWAKLKMKIFWSGAIVGALLGLYPAFQMWQDGSIWAGLGILLGSLVIAGFLALKLYERLFPVYWGIQSAFALWAAGHVLFSPSFRRPLTLLFDGEFSASVDALGAAFTEAILMKAAFFFGCLAFVGYVMWVQNFGANFREFFGDIFNFDGSNYTMRAMVSGAVNRAGSTLVAMATVQRMPVGDPEVPTEPAGTPSSDPSPGQSDAPGASHGGASSRDEDAGSWGGAGGTPDGEPSWGVPEAEPAQAQGTQSPTQSTRGEHATSSGSDQRWIDDEQKKGSADSPTTPRNRESGGHADEAAGHHETTQHPSQSQPAADPAGHDRRDRGDPWDVEPETEASRESARSPEPAEPEIPPHHEPFDCPRCGNTLHVPPDRPLRVNCPECDNKTVLRSSGT